jgi:hypothetical protein
MLDPNDLLDVQEAVEYSGLTKQRLYQLGQQVGYKIGSVWIFSRSKLDAYKQAPKRKGGRPAGSKIAAALMTPVLAV